MTKIKKFIIPCIICILSIIIIYFIFLNISINNEISLLKAKNSELESNNFAHSSLYTYYKDSNYKLFFGEWEVTMIIDENSRFGAYEDANKLIGKIMYFSSDEVKIDNKTVASSPTYSYYVIPKTEISFRKYMYTSDELGISGDFTLYIDVNSEDYNFSPKQFIVKDDNTLILYENNAYYEMKRISYISDNVESNYVQP